LLSLCLVALVLATMVVSTGAATAAIPPPGIDEVTREPALDWKSCLDAECATLEVPLDDDVVGGPTIGLALIRYEARDPDRRIGSLLVNPGGPGASGVEYAAAAASSLPEELQDRFDIVGFDPRGVGLSAGVDCTDDLDAYYDLEFAPDDEAERAALVAGVEELVRACEASDGSILPYLSTDRTARDLDRIREALGDDKLTYLGYSYGTYLGSWYAEQFPDRVRALVLDGAVDPALDATAVQVEQAEGFERALDLFLRDCARDDACAFHNDGEPGDAYDRLRAAVGETPLATDDDDGRELNGTLFDVAVLQYLYAGRGSWSSLAGSLAAAAEGDGTSLLEVADTYTGRSDDGEYSDTTDAFLAVGCADGPPVGGIEGLRVIEEAAAKAAPRVGRTVVNNSLACALWPVEAAPPAPLRARGAPPMLVLGTRNDPATPFVWARGLARQLEEGILVSAGGERHTAFNGANGCINRIVVRYLVDLDVPDDPTRC
jgi:pimeloyl-ACP methyl ester carboxylesterase